MGLRERWIEHFPKFIPFISFSKKKGVAQNGLQFAECLFALGNIVDSLNFMSEFLV